LQGLELAHGVGHGLEVGQSSLLLIQDGVDQTFLLQHLEGGRWGGVITGTVASGPTMPVQRGACLLLHLKQPDDVVLVLLHHAHLLLHGSQLRAEHPA
jgi:hypothetical protein